MAKIYLKENREKGKGKKKKNEHNRKRDIIMNFRCTPEERDMIETRIGLSGLPKGQFIRQSLLHQKVTAIGNVKSFEAIRMELLKIDQHIQALNKPEEADSRIIQALKDVAEIIQGFYEEGDYDKEKNNR